MRAVYGKKVYIGDETLIDKAYICFKGSKIHSVSHKKPACKLIGSFDTITPAFIDAHSHIALSRSGEPDDDDDVNDEMEPILFDLDALDGIIMEDSSLRESVENGILYSCVMPGSGNVIGGKGIVIRNFATNAKDAFMGYSGIKAAFGHNPKSTTDWKGTRATTRMGTVALLRKELKKGLKCRSLLKRRKKIKDEIEPYMETVISLLNRWERLRIHAHKTDDIIAALRLAEEFDLDITIEHAGDVNRSDTFELLKKRKIPVSYGPMDSFPYKVELKNESWRNVRHLIDSGVKFALISDHPVVLQRNLLLELRHLRRFGLSKGQCISKITRNAAEILKIAKSLGTLEKGKFASFVCFSGDPFSLDSFPVLVYGEGKKVHEEK